ncbi:hypothetical protein GCM10022255_026410 [Dactylosporangium darangshiense]|uniref:Uncharacterized protein n=1 Tax=Dactylosporangium darangshiense TaxID=579108 RepID=A0ABP8D5Q7_9ACTN
MTFAPMPGGRARLLRGRRMRLLRGRRMRLLRGRRVRLPRGRLVGPARAWSGEMSYATMPGGHVRLRASMER